jgi:hypothetical protein
MAVAIHCCAAGFSAPAPPHRAPIRGVNAIHLLRSRTVTSARSSTRHGEAADSEQVLVENDHCSGRQVFGDLVKVGEDDRCLLRGSASD